MYGWFVNAFPLSSHSVSALQKSTEKATHPFQVFWKQAEKQTLITLD